MKRLMILCAMVALVTTASGCSRRIGDFTIVSTKNYEASVKYKMVGRASGSDIVYFFGYPDLKNAVDDAIESKRGVYLTNAVIEWYSGFGSGYEITGDVWAPADVSDLSNPTADLYELREVADGVVLTNGVDQIAVK